MKVLTKMVQQYETRHGGLPQKIVATPLALAALAIKASAAPLWNGIPVESREIQTEEVVRSGPNLGLDLDGAQLVSFDLL